MAAGPAYPHDLERAAISLTFGDQAENGPGMEKIGAPRPAGLGEADLLRAKASLEAAGARCEILDLVAGGGVEGYGGDEGPEPALVLVVRGGVDALLGPGGARALAAEQAALPGRGMPPDSKALFRGAVKNKLARHNLCFGDYSQEPDYGAGKGRVVAFADVPGLARLRAGVEAHFGPKAGRLPAEGNYYYDPARCGIGFHGDSERRIVVAARLGPPTPLEFQWYLRSAPIGRRVRVALGPGDMYAMSEKAVGRDWRRPSTPTLRHAAGAPKYLR